MGRGLRREIDRVRKIDYHSFCYPHRLSFLIKKFDNDICTSLLNECMETKRCANIIVEFLLKN